MLTKTVIHKRWNYFSK